MNIGDQIKVELPEWLMKKKDLASRHLAGRVKAAGQKAILLECYAIVKHSVHCLRCGREITEPVSRVTGYGPVCSEKLGIPREGEFQAIQEAVKQETLTEVWLPTSYLNIEVKKKGEVKLKARFTVEDNDIIMKVPYKYKDLSKSITGRRWVGSQKVWKAPASATIADEIMRKFDLPDLKCEYSQEFMKLVETAEAIEKAAEMKDAEELPDIPETKFPAWHHQKQAFWFAKDLPAAMLAMDMGTGKSKVAIDLICNRGHNKILIICPKSVIDVWPKEFQKHSIKDYKVVPLDQKSVQKKYEVMKENYDDKVVFVVNYESVWRPPLGPEYKKNKQGKKVKVNDGYIIDECNFDLVVLDESHRIKAPGGKASLYLKHLGKQVPYRLCLTGTPLPHSPLDVYGQYRFLDPGIFGTSFNRFKNRYAIMGGYGGYEILGYQNDEEFHEKFYSIAYKCDAEDVLDLPEKMFLTRTCQLSSKARKIYDQLAEQFVAEIGDGEITVLNALSKLLRLQQITSGYLPDDEGNIHQIDTSKKELLQDILEDIDPKEPIVVFARFRHDLDNIREVAEKLKRSYCELSGRIDQLKEWQEGEYNVIGVQIQSGGVGVDLTRSRYSIYYSLGYSLGDYQQSLARIHRPGQERNTTFIHLIAENTVDEKVEAALQKKKDIIDYILEEVGN